jgi:hypothetical protein
MTVRTAGAFWGVVLRAMTTGMATPDGRPLAATVGVDAFSGRYTVTYRLERLPVGTRTFTVDERLRRIAQLTFELDKYERRRGYATMIAIDERLRDNLVGTAASLTAAIGPDDSCVWAGRYDWAPDRERDNAAAVAAAVHAVHAAVAGQSVWDASELPARVHAIGGPAAGDGAAGDPGGRDAWARLITRATPAQLLSGLDQIQSGLGQAVFTQVTTWYGQALVG